MLHLVINRKIISPSVIVDNTTCQRLKPQINVRILFLLGQQSPLICHLDKYSPVYRLFYHKWRHRMLFYYKQIQRLLISRMFQKPTISISRWYVDLPTMYIVTHPLHFRTLAWESLRTEKSKGRRMLTLSPNCLPVLLLALLIPMTKSLIHLPISYRRPP